MKRVIWCDRGWYPVYYGFCPSEQAWKREMRRLGAELEPYPKTDARCLTFEHEGKTAILVTLNERLDGRDPMAIVALIVHEAVHVWQAICNHIGETHPSNEAEAYAVQAITTGLMVAYSKTRLAK